MQRTRATRSHAASLPASPSGSTFQTGSAASSPLQRSATVTATGGANGRGSDYGTSTPMPLSAVPSAATLSGQLSGRSSPRGRNASRGVDARQTQQLDADDEQDEADETRSDKGKGVAREAAASSAAGSETIAGGHANPTAPRKDDDDDDKAQRQRQIERVLKRAQATKLARNFRNRIQLAAFKNQRGWQDVKLDVIEPHLEQEAQQRKQHMTLQAAAAQSAGGHAQALFDAPRDNSNQYHHHNHHPQQPQYQLPVYVPTGRMASDSYQPQLGGGGMDAILGGRELVGHAAGADSPSSAQQHHLYHSQQQLQQHPPQQHYQQPDGPPTKRTRTARGDLSATYSAQDVYAPQPFPLPHSSAPYATGEVYQPPLAGGSRYPNRMYSDALASNHNAAVAATAYEHVWDSRTSPDGSRSLRQRGPFPGGMPSGGAAASTEMYSLPAPAAHRPPPQTHSSPRTRAAARRSSPPKQPLSSSDPTFSSFVDAANALTGMARAPSDPALNGIGASGDDNEDRQARSLAQRSMDMSAGGGLHHSSSSAPGPGGAANGYALPRPSTPEHQVVKLPGAPNGGGGGSGGGGDGATAEGAAELMLFLAASPSPVQNRKAPPPPTLGDGMPTKGRRLFSGMGTGAGEGGDASTSFGGELDPFGGSGGSSSRPHDVGSNNNNNNNTDSTNGRSIPAPAPFATASPSADPSKHFATAPSSSSSSSIPHHPQQQQQDPSSHTAFMPSAPATPGQRQRQPSLGGAWESFINASPSPKRGAATRRSRGGGGIYGSNEHADAIGAADGSSGGGGGGIGGGPGNGQATVTW